MSQLLILNKADQIIESGTLSKWLTQAKDFLQMTKYFGTDGIRGAYGAKLINEDFVQKVGFAIGKFVNKQTDSIPTILVGGYTSFRAFSPKSITSGLSSWHPGSGLWSCPFTRSRFWCKIQKADFVYAYPLIISIR